jgi:hypothetical protein
MNRRSGMETQQVLERLAREGTAGPAEVALVACSGASVSGWAIKVKSLVSYNVYKVCAVILGSPGSVPVEIGSEVEAVNMAESYNEQGQLGAGTYAVMWKSGEKYIFYAPVQE